MRGRLHAHAARLFCGHAGGQLPPPPLPGAMLGGDAAPRLAAGAPLVMRRRWLSAGAATALRFPAVGETVQLRLAPADEVRHCLCRLSFRCFRSEDSAKWGRLLTLPHTSVCMQSIPQHSLPCGPAAAADAVGPRLPALGHSRGRRRRRRWHPVPDTVVLPPPPPLPLS